MARGWIGPVILSPDHAKELGLTSPGYIEER